MMWKFFVILLLPSIIWASGNPKLLKESPLDELNLLILSTEELVVKQKKLQQTLEKYLALHDAYLADSNNRSLLIDTARSAAEALEMIKEEKLAPLFEPVFLSEMTLFGKLVTKPSIPAPE